MLHILKAYICLFQIFYDVYSWIYRIYKINVTTINLFGEEPKKNQSTTMKISNISVNSK